jgi:hypothetical protein
MGDSHRFNLVTSPTWVTRGRGDGAVILGMRRRKTFRHRSRSLDEATLEELIENVLNPRLARRAARRWARKARHIRPSI